MTIATAFKVLTDCFRVDADVPRRVPVLSVNNDNSRSVLFEGRYYSPLVDTIMDDLARRSVESFSVSRIASRIRGDRSHAVVYAPDGSFARALVEKHCRRLLRPRASAYSPMEEYVWERILRSSGARKVVGIQPSRELCAAARRLGVWVSDLQHGVIAHGHPWYDEASRGNEPAEWLPNAFLVWDESSADVTRRWVKKLGVRTWVIGHPWLSRFRANAPDDVVVRAQSAKYQGHLPPRDREANILVSLSWGEVDIPNGFLAAPLLEAIQKSSDRFNWMIRLHPNQMRGFASNEGETFPVFHARELSSRVEWRMASEAPLPVVLAATDLHVSWTSSVTIEAALMGVRTALLNPKLLPGGMYSNYFTEQREAGFVDVLPASSREILDWIGRNRDVRHAPASTLEAEQAYRELIDFLAEPRS